MRSFIFLLTVCISSSMYVLAQKTSSKATPSVSLKSSLEELTEISLLPSYKTNTISGQVSSWDTSGGNDDGFSGKYSYIKRNADSTLVIFDMKGPGVINRIWTPTPSNDSLAFYIDDMTHPSFTICYQDLFTGKVFPFVSPLCANQLGGYFCYLPIPFQKQCRIVLKGKKTQFHQVQYRLYPAKTSVKSFTMKLDEAEKMALQRLGVQWRNQSSAMNFYHDQQMTEDKQSFQLQPGQSHTIFKSQKPGRILGIEFDPAAGFEGLEKQIDIRITWDDEKFPAVQCPVADFFGYAFGKISMQSLLIGTAGSRNYSYFPMPFDKSATIELMYRKTDKPSGGLMEIRSKVIYSSEARDPQREGRFYAHWNRSNPTKRGQPHIFLQANGKGHYVGTLLQAQGLTSGMTYFFEGDDSTAVDGQFRMHGTGSEDYFNGGWYALPDRWDAPMSLPLSGALDYSLPFCRTGGFRLLISDKISFEKSIYHSIEHGPARNLAPTDYTSVSFYYSDTPPAISSAPVNENTKVFMPDTLTLYPMLMNMGIDGEIAIKPAGAYPTGGTTYFCTVANDAGLRIQLKEIPQGDYQLYMDDAAGPDGCSYSVWQRQSRISGWIDRYNSTVTRDPKKYLCDIHIDALINTITFRFKAAPGKNKFVFNRLILIRK
ncbi:MAG: glycoside hydrolase family 172 protein [Bacteroidota bacterium]